MAEPASEQEAVLEDPLRPDAHDPEVRSVRVCKISHELLQVFPFIFHLAQVHFLLTMLPQPALAPIRAIGRTREKQQQK